VTLQYSFYIIIIFQIFETNFLSPPRFLISRLSPTGLLDITFKTTGLLDITFKPHWFTWYHV